MRYIDKTLLANESLIYFCRPHWVVFFKSLIMLLPTLILFFGGVYLLASVFLLITLFSLASAIIVFLTSEFGLTNRRVIIKLGFIRRYTFENRLSRIESIEIDQSILGRLLNYGTICIRGIGGSGELFPIVPNPLQFRKKVQEQLEIITQGKSEA